MSPTVAPAWLKLKSAVALQPPLWHAKVLFTAWEGGFLPINIALRCFEDGLYNSLIMTWDGLWQPGFTTLIIVGQTCGIWYWSPGISVGYVMGDSWKPSGNTGISPWIEKHQTRWIMAYMPFLNHQISGQIWETFSELHLGWTSTLATMLQDTTYRLPTCTILM